VDNVIDLGKARAKRDEPYVTQANLGRHFRVSTRTIQRWHSRPGFPVEYRFGRPRYKLSAIEAWFQQEST
jgi:hypothetical protein